ncbi:metallophosphoesterase [bacterium]|nr:metallophosphoesterase [bacterium]
MSVHILYTNDLHNHAGPLAHLEAHRQANSLLLDGGDALAGSNTAFRWNEPILHQMRRLGYAAMTMGNREFHYCRWIHRWREQEREFPLLACNLQDLRQPQWPWRAWLEARPKVIVVGATPVQYPVGSAWENLTGFRFLDPFQCLPPLLEELRPRADALIFMSHLGLKTDLQLAERGVPVDLILGAHSHDFTPEPIWRGRIPIVQGGSNGRYLAEVELEPGSSRLGWTVHNCA